MVEVKLYLYDAQEIAFLAQFEAALAQKRNMQPVMQTETPLAHAPTSEPGVDGTAQGTGPREVSDIEVAQAITTYAKTHGAPAAKDMLVSFGVDRVTKIPPEKRAEFMAKVGA